MQKVVSPKFPKKWTKPKRATRVCAPWWQRSTLHTVTHTQQHTNADIHFYTQFKEEAKAQSALVNEYKLEVKTYAQKAKNLNREVSREKYLAKKATRSVEDAIQAVADARLSAQQTIDWQQERIIALETKVKAVNKTLQIEVKKNKRDALAEHSESVRRLQKKQMELQSSIETWQTKYVVVVFRVVFTT